MGKTIKYKLKYKIIENHILLIIPVRFFIWGEICLCLFLFIVRLLWGEGVSEMFGFSFFIYGISRLCLCRFYVFEECFFEDTFVRCF